MATPVTCHNSIYSNVLQSSRRENVQRNYKNAGVRIGRSEGWVQNVKQKQTYFWTRHLNSYSNTTLHAAAKPWLIKARLSVDFADSCQTACSAFSQHSSEIPPDPHEWPMGYTKVELLRAGLGLQGRKSWTKCRLSLSVSPQFRDNRSPFNEMLLWHTTVLTLTVLWLLLVRSVELNDL